jgi:ABC-type transport system involved in multi-copper enzyme maturation permease subunit
MGKISIILSGIAFIMLIIYGVFHLFNGTLNLFGGISVIILACLVFLLFLLLISEEYEKNK